MPWVCQIASSTSSTDTTTSNDSTCIMVETVMVERPEGVPQIKGPMSFRPVEVTLFGTRTPIPIAIVCPQARNDPKPRMRQTLCDLLDVDFELTDLLACALEPHSAVGPVLLYSVLKGPFTDAYPRSFVSWSYNTRLVSFLLLTFFPP